MKTVLSLLLFTLPSIGRGFAFLFVITMLLVFPNPAPGGDWLGQEPVELEKGDEGFWSPTISFDSLGRAWVFFMASTPEINGHFQYKYWDGSAWAPKRTFPNSPGRKFRLRGMIGEDDQLWAVWHVDQDGRDIVFSHGDGSTWTDVQLVHAPNSRQDFAPMIATGGGQVWVTWYGAKDNEPYRVFASRWNGTAWIPEVELSAGIPGDHWFTDLTVDNEGRAHVVWGERTTRLIYYSSSLDGVDWKDPFAINPHLLGVAMADWAAPSLRADFQGNIHVCWVGRTILSDGSLEDWDIFYSRYDGTHWTAPKQANPDNDHTDAYPDLCVANGKIWIAWYGANPATLGPSPVLAVQWDGSKIIESYRLDNDQYTDDSVPSVEADASGLPWVVWSTKGQNRSNGGVVLNRYSDLVPVTLTALEAHQVPGAVELTWWGSPGVFRSFAVERMEGGGFVELDHILDRGEGTHSWMDETPGTGLRTYRVLATRRDGRTESLGPISIEVGTSPQSLSLDIQRIDFGDLLRLSVGLPTGSEVSLTLFDVQGKRMGSPKTALLPRGWSELSWELRSPSGRRLPNGLYFARVAAPRIGHVTAKVLLSR